MDKSGKLASNCFNDPFSNIPLADIDIGRESIPILDLSSSFGRESLGILKLGCDFSAADLSYQNSGNSYNILDQAFILSKGASDTQSASTLSLKSSNFSFNLNGFNTPSIIGSNFSNSVQVKGSTNVLNDGFLYNSGPLYKQFRSRFFSVPVYTTKKSDNDNSKQLVQQMFNRVSEGYIKMNTSFKEDLNQQDNGFNDSVFIEARHLTSKFSDEGSNDGFILDETDPPKLIHAELDDCRNNCDSDDIVVKQIDELLPADGYQKLRNKTGECLSEQTSITMMQSAKDKIETCSMEQSEKIVTNEETGSTKNDVNKSKEILQTLSQILANDNRTERDAEEGHALLNTLADMLGNGCRERSKSFSNHSTRTNGNSFQLHTSTNSNANASQTNHSNSERSMKLSRLSNSFSHSSKDTRSKLTTSFGRSHSMDMPKNRSARSTASESSVEIKTALTENKQINMKMRKTSNTTSQAKRGPMKALVPLENISKARAAKGTPPKTLPRLNSKMSTPIHEVHLKPMAQSTPDNKTANYSSSTEKSNVKSFSSPNLREKSSNYSSQTSLKDLSTSQDRSLQKSYLPRRNSISDSRRSSISSELKRSNSLKETRLMKTMGRISQNISASIASRGPLRDSSNMSEKRGSNNSFEKANDTSRNLKSQVLIRTNNNF